MFFRMIYEEKLAQAAYLIGCQRTGEAIIVDPQRDIDRYERIAKAEGLRITGATETHIHADFLSGVREFAERGATVYLSGEGDANWKYEWLGSKVGGGEYEHQLLHDGDKFRVGNIELKAVHTPGHTPEHMSFLVTDFGGGATEPMGAITGDFLFVGDLGRPDLLESAAGKAGASDPSARALYKTVQRLNEWPDYLQIWPGHGAGSACGKALGAVPQSTLGYEKRFNAAILAAATEEAFVKFILEGQPEPPMYFARMKRDNRLGPPVLGSVPKPRELSAQEMAALDGTKCAIVDARAWDLYRAGHIAGSLSHPINKSFPTDAGSMIRESEDIYLIIDPARVDEGVRDLIRIGFDKIIGYFDATKFTEIVSAGAKINTTPEVSVAEARAMIDRKEVAVLDVRRATEFAAGHIDCAKNIAHTRLDGRLDEVPAGTPLLVQCQGGWRSARACALLEKHGHTVTNLAGGFAAWAKQAPAGLK